MYADDTTILHYASSDVNDLQETLATYLTRVAIYLVGTKCSWVGGTVVLNLMKSNYAWREQKRRG